MKQYSAAVKLQPDSATLYLNRAMAYIRMSRWPRALEDCNAAVALDPQSHKAYYRRAKAKRGLKDLKVGHFQ